jgi:ferritin-like metal-binding protein YciE
MAKVAQSEELRAAFKKHEAETEDQVGRLEHLFAAIDRAAKQDLRGHRRHC